MSEWAVDFGVQGGTDKEGWQYAADFPVYVTVSGQTQQSETSVTPVLLFSNSTFHGHKTMKDFVRRRRWTR